MPSADDGDVELNCAPSQDSCHNGHKDDSPVVFQI
jgi:hypothetical protein